MASLSKGTFGVNHGAGLEKLPVQSSFIDYCEYDAASFRLTVTFKSGAVRNYAMIQPQAWNDFKVAPSKGRAYNQLIKGRAPSVPVLEKRVGRKKKGL